MKLSNSTTTVIARSIVILAAVMRPSSSWCVQGCARRCNTGQNQSCYTGAYLTWTITENLLRAHFIVALFNTIPVEYPPTSEEFLEQFTRNVICCVRTSNVNFIFSWDPTVTATLSSANLVIYFFSNDWNFVVTYWFFLIFFSSVSAIFRLQLFNKSHFPMFFSL